MRDFPLVLHLCSYHTSDLRLRLLTNQKEAVNQQFLSDCLMPVFINAY